MAGLGATAKVLAALKAFVLQHVEPLKLNALVRYRVISVGADKRLSLQIVRKAAGFPDVLPIDIWPGLPGGHGEPAAGSVVLVTFVEGNPSMPVVTHFARKSDAGFVPVNASLDASSTLRLGEHATDVNAAKALGAVIREGDTVSIAGGGPASGIITVTLGLGLPPEKSRLKA